MNMETELYDKPGVIIAGNDVVKTTKVKKWIAKNKPSEFKVQYLNSNSTDFKEIEKELQLLVDSIKGITHTKEKEIFISESDYEYQYRVNVNTIYCSHSKEGLQWLLSKNNIDYLNV